MFTTGNAIDQAVNAGFPAQQATFGATGGLGSGSPLTKGQLAFGGIAGGGLDILSSILGGQSQQKGFEDLQSQIQRGIGVQQQDLAKALGLLSPFQQTGATAMQRELGLLGEGGTPTGLVNQILGQFQQSPAQKASIEAGLEAAQGRSISQGLGGSGAEAKALEQFAQQQTAGQQQQFLQDVLGARGQTLGGLGQLSGIGLGAAQTGAGSAIRSGEDVGSLLESLGQTQLAQQQAQAKSTGGLLGGIGGIAGGLASLFGI